MKSRILLVDDEKDFRETMSELLKTRYDVYLAADGLSAIEQIEKHTIDLIISDYNMPKSNGLDLLKKVGQLRSPIPMIIASGQGFSDSESQVLKMGACQLLDKPFSIEQLFTMIESTLSKPQINEPIPQEKSFTGLDWFPEDLLKEYQKHCEDQNTSIQESLRALMERELRIGKSEFSRERQVTLAELAGSISHEINNPITIVYGKIQLARNQLEKGTLTDEKIKDLLDSISKNSHRVVKIVKGLKSLASFEESGDRQTCSIKELLEEAMSLVNMQLNQTGVSVNITYKQENLTIEGYPTQLLQVLIILIKNASEALKMNRVPDPKIDITVERQTDFIQVCVNDNGPGVPMDLQDRIFNTFCTTKGKEGSGLGLSIAKRIVKHHKGQIYINNAVSSSCFCINLPLSKIVEPEKN